MIDLPPATGPAREAYTVVANLFRAGVAAVDPERATADAIAVRAGRMTVGLVDHAIEGRVIVVGMGKAAVRMAIGAERSLAGLDVRGTVVAKDISGERERPRHVEVLEASHPLPDERSIAAGARLLSTVSAASPGDIVLALVSGGGSALAESLRSPVTLDDLRATTDALLRAGATINQLNAVRRGLSRIKAGGLLAASPVPLIPLILSDVIGNDLGTIASGAVIPGPPRSELLAEARRTVEALGVAGRLPESVRRVLDEPGDDAGRERLRDAIPPTIIGDNASAVAAMGVAARRSGLRVGMPDAWQGRTGEASDIGSQFVEVCRSVLHDVDVVLGGGEATVTVRGDGDGGRNTEFALAAAIRLAEQGETGWVIASLATDGEDATTGAAGAAVDGASTDRAGAAGIDARDALARNDSLPWCRAAGGLVESGSTGTNVNDLYIGVRAR